MPRSPRGPSRAPDPPVFTPSQDSGSPHGSPAFPASCPQACCHGHLPERHRVLGPGSGVAPANPPPAGSPRGPCGGLRRSQPFQTPASCQQHGREMPGVLQGPSSSRCPKTSALVPGPGGAWAEVTGARGRPSLASRTPLVRSSPHCAVSYVWRARAWASVRVKSSNKRRWESRCPGTRGPRQSALISGNLLAVSGLT